MNWKLPSESDVVVRPSGSGGPDDRDGRAGKRGAVGSGTKPLTEPVVCARSRRRERYENESSEK